MHDNLKTIENWFFWNVRKFEDYRELRFLGNYNIIIDLGFLEPSLQVRVFFFEHDHLTRIAVNIFNNNNNNDDDNNNDDPL